MNKTLKLAASLWMASCLWLTGCASAPQLGHADTSGFDAKGTTVLVDYAVPVDKDLDEQEQAEMHAERLREVHELLKAHGFRTVASGPSAFTVRVVEGRDRDVSSEWQGAIGANVALFTLGIVPAMFDYRNELHYELWAKNQRVHAIDMPANWKKAEGLVSLSTTLSKELSKRSARVGVHDSVIRLWIDQGSFE